MIQITFSALGEIRKYIPNEVLVTIPESKTLDEILIEEFNIPKTENRICCVVNGKIERLHYCIKPNDKVVVMRMGGAG